MMVEHTNFGPGFGLNPTSPGFRAASLLKSKQISNYDDEIKTKCSNYDAEIKTNFKLRR